jgi:hypothetical protein
MNISVYTTPLTNLKGTPDEHNVSRVSDKELEKAAHAGIPSTAYITIDSRTIDLMDDLFEKTPFIRSLFSITMDNILAGGISIKIGGKYIDGAESSFQQQMWGNWIRDMVRNMWKYGFSFWLIKKDGIGRKFPSVIDMNMVVIKMYLSASNDCRFVLYERGSTGFDMGVHNAPILDTNCFCWDRPSANGELRSKMYTIQGHLQYFNTVCTYVIDGMRGQTHPALVVEPVETKHNSDNLHYDFFPNMIGRVQRDTDPVAVQVDEATAEEIKSASAQAFLLNNAQVANSHAHSVMQTHEMDEQKLTNIIRLPKNYVLSNPNAPQQPRDFDSFRRMFEEQLAALFGVPVNMFNPQTSTRNGDEASRDTFQANQRVLKQQIIDMMTDAFYVINVQEAEYLALISKDAEDLTTEDVKSTRHKHDVMIELPGIPNDDHMRTLYLEGTLKYDYYRRFMARKLCMPEEAFEETPKMDLKDLNGIKPLPTATPGGAGSLTSKSKNKKKRKKTPAKTSFSLTESAPKKPKKTKSKAA